MTTVYVATTGNDNAAGTEAAPLRTIAKGLAKAVPGDTVLVRPGTYAEGQANGLTMPRAGKPGAWITLRSEVPLGAKIRPNLALGSCYAIIEANSYCVIDGFDVSTPLRFDNAGRAIDSGHNHGILFWGAHHVVVRNCLATNGRESGIAGTQCDFITLEGNETANNSWMDWGSGISIYEPVLAALGAGEEEPAWRIVIRGNVSHHNQTMPAGNRHTDGNGIIIDDFHHGQNEPRIAYDKGCLVENNLCYSNGGKGIAVHWSDNCLVRRNTCADDNLDLLPDPVYGVTTWRGELSQQDCSGNRWEGNLAVPNKAHAANAGIGYYGGNSRSTWTGNATTDAKPNLGNGSTLPGSGNLYNVDPQLVDWVPQNPALAEIGWRPSGVTPTPVPDPVPEPPMPDAPAELSPFAAMVPTGIISENVAYELGTVIRADKAGRITALRVYRLNTSNQPIRLWKSGEKIAEGSIAGGAEGWVEVAVDVPAAAGDEFVVSVGKAAQQRYAADDALGAAVTGDGFTIPARGGVYSFTRGEFPTKVYQSSYYWIDVRFAADVVVPEPEPDDLAARLDALTARVAALEAMPPAQVEYGPRILALEERAATTDAALADLHARLAAVEEAAVPDLSGIQEELARLDARLDAIGRAAGD